MVKSFRLMGKGGFGGIGSRKGKKSKAGAFSPKNRVGPRALSPQSISESEDEAVIVSDDEFEGGFVKPEERPKLTLEGTSLTATRIADADIHASGITP